MVFELDSRRSRRGGGVKDEGVDLVGEGGGRVIVDVG